MRNNPAITRDRDRLGVGQPTPRDHTSLQQIGAHPVNGEMGHRDLHQCAAAIASTTAARPSEVLSAKTFPKRSSRTRHGIPGPS
jgi:hypothetical protein